MSRAGHPSTCTAACCVAQQHPATCHATCCDLESVADHHPFCSRECKQLHRAVWAAGNAPPKLVGGMYVPPPVAPWSWLDARAAS